MTFALKFSFIDSMEGSNSKPVLKDVNLQRIRDRSQVNHFMYCSFVLVEIVKSLTSTCIRNLNLPPNIFQTLIILSLQLSQRLLCSSDNKHYYEVISDKLASMCLADMVIIDNRSFD